MGEQSAEQTTSPDTPDVNDTEMLVDDLLGTPEGKPTPEKTEAEKTDAGKVVPGKEPDSPPLAAGPSKSPLSKTTSESRSKSARGISKPSVKQELREITAAKKAKETKEADTPVRDGKAAADKTKPNPSTTHKQPTGGKSKSKKSKERS